MRKTILLCICSQVASWSAAFLYKPSSPRIPRNLGVLLRRNSRWHPKRMEYHQHYLNWRSSVQSISSSLPDHASRSDVGSNNVGDEVQDNNRRMKERHLRFAGVGRLYVTTTDNNHNKSKLESETKLDAHLSVVERLTKSTVAIVGLGGVGSWSAEALCRSGVGNMILIDLDDICISNTNRQLHATSSSVGKFKIDEMKKRLVDINPHCNVTTIHDFISTENVHDIIDQMLPELDVCLDAIDGTREKTALIAACTEKQIPIVTCGGAAGRRDPRSIEVEDLTRVDNDRLLRAVRKNLRQKYGFQKGLPRKETLKGKHPKKWQIQAVYSTEIPKELPQGEEDASSLRRCDGALGTACFVTGTFGFIVASRVVDMLASDKMIIPRSG